MRHQQDKSGFTLVELLVVLFLVGVMGSMVVLAIPSNDPTRVVQGEARRLARFLRDAASEAILRGHPMGVWLARRGYQLAAFDAEHHRWQLPEQETGATLQRLPEGFLLALWLEQQGVVIPEWPPLQDRSRLFPAGSRPQVVFSPAGATALFRLRLTSGGEKGSSLDLLGYPMGRVTVTDLVDRGKRASWSGAVASH